MFDSAFSVSVLDAKALSFHWKIRQLLWMFYSSLCKHGILDQTINCLYVGPYKRPLFFPGFCCYGYKDRKNAGRILMIAKCLSKPWKRNLHVQRQYRYIWMSHAETNNRVCAQFERIQSHWVDFSWKRNTVLGGPRTEEGNLYFLPLIALLIWRVT